MSIFEKLNSPMLYAICGGIIAFVALVCVVFLVRAYRVGIQLGMDRAKLRRVVISSATFSVLPRCGYSAGGHRSGGVSGHSLALAAAVRHWGAAL